MIVSCVLCYDGYTVNLSVRRGVTRIAFKGENHE